MCARDCLKAGAWTLNIREGPRPFRHGGAWKESAVVNVLYLEAWKGLREAPKPLLLPGAGPRLWQ